MSLSNFKKRFILFITAVPAIFLIVFFLPHFNNLTVCISILVFGIAGSFETKRILFENSEKGLIPFFLPSLVTLSAYFDTLIRGTKGINITLTAFFLLVFIIFSKQIIIGSADNFKQSVLNISKELFLLIYPSSFTVFLIFIANKFKNGNLWFLLFLFMVFANDTFCYLGGKLMGKNNQGIIKASPKKSIAGFITGYIFTIIIGYIFMLLFKENFSAFLNMPYYFIPLCLIISTASNIGDLIESVIKRAGNIKDSGKSILGRGGVLDSIDSIIISAPFFYCSLLIYGNFIDESILIQ